MLVKTVLPSGFYRLWTRLGIGLFFSDDRAVFENHNSHNQHTENLHQKYFFDLGNEYRYRLQTFGYRDLLGIGRGLLVAGQKEDVARRVKSAKPPTIRAK